MEGLDHWDLGLLMILLGRNHECAEIAMEGKEMEKKSIRR